MAKDIFVKSIFDNCRICMACHLYAPYFVLSAYPLVNSILDNILMWFFYLYVWMCSHHQTTYFEYFYLSKAFITILTFTVFLKYALYWVFPSYFCMQRMSGNDRIG